MIVTKAESSNAGCLKCFGWFFTMILLCGAIAVAVLIGVGVIDTTPRRVKEAREIASTKSELNGNSLDLVDNPGSPNVLTNDPYFFNDKQPPKNASKTF